MANFKNDGFVRMITHDTFPLSATKTGTITVPNTSDRVIGTSTKFKSELQVGGWICDIANDEIRKITAILTDTNLTIDKPFSNNLSGATLKYVEPSIYTEISIIFNSVAGKIDGVACPPSIGFAYGKTGRDQSAQRDFVDPLIIDATGTSANIAWSK